MGSRIVNAFIDASATLGARSTVWHYARILAGVRIGADCSIGGGAEIGRGSLVGDRTRISAGVFLPSDSFVGTDVFIGPNATFTDDRYPRTLAPGETYNAEPPVIGNGASIGAGAIILPGVRIGDHARIAAGAVVAHDVEPHAIVVGIPARVSASASAKAHWTARPEPAVVDVS